MATTEPLGVLKPALEISTALAGRRFGLCGFDETELQRIAAILRETAAFAVPIDERLFADSARICDVIVIKLFSLGPEAMRAAAASAAPVLAVARGQALLTGTGGAYRWPRDFIDEPWSDHELLLRMFRLLDSCREASSGPPRKLRTEPLVLLADDDPEWVALVDVTLRNDGIVCRMAETGLACLRLARELSPDLIVLDVRMPGMNGFEVLETIRRDPALQTIPVALLTACDEPADVLRGSSLRADDYLVKPVSANVLLNRVKRMLSRAGIRAWTRSWPGGPGGSGRRRWMMAGSDAAASGERS